jgi:predicted permease
MNFALRQLLKTPGFTAIALLTLALGIGVNTTAFSVLNVLLHHELPYPAAPELVRVYRTYADSSGRGAPVHSPGNFYDLLASETGCSHLAAFITTNLNFSEPGQPADRLRSLLVSSDFFATLGVAPELGRTFTSEEDRTGKNAVVIISHASWLQRFSADPAIVGRQLRIDGEPVTVIGVMPAAFDDYQLWGEVNAWRPLALADRVRQDRNNNYLQVIGRLKPAVSLAQAQARMNTLAARMTADYPRDNARTGLNLVTLSSSIQDEMGRRVTWLIMGLAGFVLLIACANLANLQFARNSARARDHAIRTALGATRAQLMRLVLAESLLLSLAGGALGLLLALWTNDLVGRYFVWGDRVGLDIPINLPVLAFALTLSVLTGMGFGLLPAWILSRVNVGDALKQGARGSTSSRAQHRTRHALIVSEVALALMLLAGAGFFRDGLERFAHREPGWRTDGLLAGYLNLRGPSYANPAARTAFFQRLQEKLGAVPGVESATVGSSLPTFGYNNNNSFVVEGRPQPEAGRGLSAAAAEVMPGFFGTLGIRLLQGRDFAVSDDASSPAVVIINEAMARQVWPGENPLGKRIGNAADFMGNPREVVGVVSDVRSVAAFGQQDGRMQMYRPFAQRPAAAVTIALRSGLAPEAVGQELRRIVASIDADQAVYRFGTLRQEINRSLASIDVAGWSLASFAVLGMLLAALGIYGVIAHSVVQRTGEFGLRLALGAQVSDIFTLVLSGGLRLAAIGAVIGLAGTFALARLLRAVSSEFAYANPAVIAGVTIVLGLVAACACVIPARRATQVDPMVALRSE